MRQICSYVNVCGASLTYRNAHIKYFKKIIKPYIFTFKLIVWVQITYLQKNLHWLQLLKRARKLSQPTSNDYPSPRIRLNFIFCRKQVELLTDLTGSRSGWDRRTILYIRTIIKIFIK